MKIDQSQSQFQTKSQIQSQSKSQVQSQSQINANNNKKVKNPIKNPIKNANASYADFTYHSYTPAKMSDSAYEKEIIKTAVNDFENGLFQNSAEFHSLERGYVSSVSPDRKSIMNTAIKDIDTKRSFKPIDLMEELFGVKLQEVGWEVLGDNLVEYKDENGETIIKLNQYGFSAPITKAEGARMQEFLKIYNNAHDMAKNGYISSADFIEPEQPTLEGTGSNFSAKI